MYNEPSKTGVMQYVSVPDSVGEWPTFSPPPLESCFGTVNVDGPNSDDQLWCCVMLPSRPHLYSRAAWSKMEHCDNAWFLGPIPETIRSLWKSNRITNFSSAHDSSIRSDSTNNPASIGSWSRRSCSPLRSVLDQKFHHNNWSFYQ